MTPHLVPSSDDFRAAMRGYIGHVSLMTVGSDDMATGLIVTSATSLSVEPPMILVCVNRFSSSWPVLKKRGGLAGRPWGPRINRLPTGFQAAQAFRGRRVMRAQRGKRWMDRACWWARPWPLPAKWTT